MPWQKRAETEDRIRNSVRRYVSQFAEEQAEDKHHEQGLNDDPDSPEHGLLVTYLDVAQGEEIEKLAIFPELAQPE